MNKVKIDCFQDSRTLIAQEIGRDVSKEDADALEKQFKDHDFIIVQIQKDGWLSKHRGVDIYVLYVYVRYPKVTIETASEGEQSFKLTYELKY